MTVADLKTCRDCGASFKRSRADKTVRCPRCRADRLEAADRAEHGDPFPGWGLTDNVRHTKTELCRCGKTVLVDGFGHSTGWTCPQCGESK